MCNSTKKVTCPYPKCGAKIEIKIGKDNGDLWETKEVICGNCRRPVKYQVNNHGNKIKLIKASPVQTKPKTFY